MAEYFRRYALGAMACAVAVVAMDVATVTGSSEFAALKGPRYGFATLKGPRYGFAALKGPRYGFAQQRGAAAAAPERFVVIGCITSEPAGAPASTGRGATSTPRYVILDKRTDPPTRYELQGDAKELDLHAGHTMEVKGPLTAPAAPGTVRGSTASFVMKVESMTWISSTCTK